MPREKVRQVRERGHKDTMGGGVMTKMTVMARRLIILTSPLPFSAKIFAPLLLFIPPGGAMFPPLHPSLIALCILSVQTPDCVHCTSAAIYFLALPTRLIEQFMGPNIMPAGTSRTT